MTDPADLERMVDRELKQLPLPHAPGTLLPRVMAAVSAAAVPWYRRPWLTWPVVWQAASAALLIVVVADLAIVLPKASGVGGLLVSAAGGTVPRRVSDFLASASQAAAVVNVIWEVFLQPVAIYLCALAVSLSVAFAALWVALDRVTLGEASHQ